MASLYARMSKKTQQKQDRTFLADNDLKKGIEAAAHTEQAASDSMFLRKLREHRPFAPSGSMVSFARPVMEEEMSALDRKALLKRQAEYNRERGL